MLDFLGIGAQKCGTTWLYSLLNNHPRLYFPPAKELHFWNNQTYPVSAPALDSYKKLFSVSVSAGKLKGEITPAYAFLPTTIIRQISQEMPDVRLFYIIRDPIARAWSSAQMALGRAEMQIEEASDQWFMDHFRSKGSLARGDYAQCLDNWLSIFKPEQLLLLQYEQITAEPHTLLKKLAQHLQIEAEPLLNHPMLEKKVFEGPGHPLRPSLKSYLEELYAEPKKRLKERYGIAY